VTRANIIGGYDSFLADSSPSWEPPDVVLRFGAVPTSNSLNSYLDGLEETQVIHISHNGVWADDSHRVNGFMHLDPVTVCRSLAAELTPRSESSWAASVRVAEEACWGALDDVLAEPYFDGSAVADMVAALPAGALLFAGNSLPVRHVVQFGRPRKIPLHVYANRGASGIDGNISTALGIGAASGAPVVAVMGDTTFYHDLNGLLAVQEFRLKVTIILLNNNGGGIFNRLPIANFEPPFKELFVAPHGLDFEPAVRMYGLDYTIARDQSAFRKILAQSLEDEVPRVIEIRTDGAADHARRQEILAHVNRHWDK
jgi:2-succinyl-5-enolpyruvyl-6-hydroxy-3-cyclohexene-1-carboxylate synthase